MYLLTVPAPRAVYSAAPLGDRTTAGLACEKQVLSSLRGPVAAPLFVFSSTANADSSLGRVIPIRRPSATSAFSVKAAAHAACASVGRGVGWRDKLPAWASFVLTKFSTVTLVVSVRPKRWQLALVRGCKYSGSCNRRRLDVVCASVSGSSNEQRFLRRLANACASGDAG